MAFNFSGATWHDVSVQALQELRFYQASAPLLPNLHTIDFRVLPPVAIQFVQLFLGPCITKVTIPITSEEEESLIELLSSLIPHLSPNIHHLSVWLPTRFSKPCSAIFQLIQGLHHLRILHFDLKQRGPHERVSAQLGGLLALHELKMSLIPAHHFQYYTTALGQFPVLTKFSFMVDNWVSAATIMDSMQCRFTDLAVTTRGEGSLSDLRTFADSMYRHPSVSSLSHLSLVDFDTVLSGADCSNASSYVEEIFSPLFAFVGLKFVHLQIDATACFRDSWYADAAAAWPSLETLSITSPNTGTVEAKMTLAGLIPLVKQCTKLESLRLGLNAQPFDPSQINNDVFNTNIQELCLETYIVPSPREVFLSLHRIFPNLEYVFRSRRFSWPWVEVNYMLHAVAVHRRGPCVSKRTECTCGTLDSQEGPLKSRPQTPGALQLQAVINTLRPRS